MEGTNGHLIVVPFVDGVANTVFVMFYIKFVWKVILLTKHILSFHASRGGGPNQILHSFKVRIFGPSQNVGLGTPL